MSWIKLEHATPDKPEVWEMAAILGIDPDAVLGKVIRIWIWADMNSLDGEELRIPDAGINRVAQQERMAEAMRSVGWLSGSGNVTFPNFLRHNSQSAKTRVTALSRQCHSRVTRKVESLSQQVTAKDGKSIIPRPLRNLVYNRDGGACRYCGWHKDDPVPCEGSSVGFMKLSLDHVVPESKGGETTAENLVTACMRCNQTKGGRTLSESGMSLICHNEAVTDPLPEKRRIEKRREEIEEREKEGGAPLIPLPSPSRSKSIPATQEEVEIYAIEQNMPRSDGRTFWDSMEAGGWMRGKNKLKDWKAHFRAWKQQGYLASQKQINNISPDRARLAKFTKI
jgi:5-methylcytosine-specific restriction endonuclease McrA